MNWNAVCALKLNEWSQLYIIHTHTHWCVEWLCTYRNGYTLPAYRPKCLWMGVFYKENLNNMYKLLESHCKLLLLSLWLPHLFLFFFVIHFSPSYVRSNIHVAKRVLFTHKHSVVFVFIFIYIDTNTRTRERNVRKNTRTQNYEELGYRTTTTQSLYSI